MDVETADRCRADATEHAAPTEAADVVGPDAGLAVTDVPMPALIGLSGGGLGTGPGRAPGGRATVPALLRRRAVTTDRSFALDDPSGTESAGRPPALRRAPTATLPARAGQTSEAPQTGGAVALVDHIHQLLRLDADPTPAFGLDGPPPSPVITDADRETILSLLLENAAQGQQILAAYQAKYKTDLIGDIDAAIGGENALRAYEYLTYGTLRPVAKVLLAINGLLNSDNVFRVLKEAHDSGDPATEWTQLVQQRPSVCKKFAGTSLDAALENELHGTDIVKAKAIAHYGALRPVDKIYVAVRGLGRVDTDLLFQGLAEGGAGVIEGFNKEFGGDLDQTLFGMHVNGQLVSRGCLSDSDVQRARVLLKQDAQDPNRLVELVRADRGLLGGPAEDKIFNDVNAVVQASNGADQAAAAAKAQLAALAAQVADEQNDPLGLYGTLLGLSTRNKQRLWALLKLPDAKATEKDPTLKDPAVQKLLQLGGGDGHVLQALEEADEKTIETWSKEYGKVGGSPFQRYVDANSPANGMVSTLLFGKTFERLKTCASEKLAKYAVLVVTSFATPKERLELRQALRLVDHGDGPPQSEAGQVVAALTAELSGDALTQLRNELQRDEIGALERAGELEENIEHDKSWVVPLSDDVKDERREMRAKAKAVAKAGGKASADQQRDLRASEQRTTDALGTYDESVDTYTTYATQVSSIAVGLLTTALSGGATAPMLFAILRVAVAGGLAKYATERAMKGARESGSDSEQAFVAGAVDGVMNVVAPWARAKIVVSNEAIEAAIKAGASGLKLQVLASATEGAMSGGVGGVVDSVLKQENWQGTVAEDIARTFDQAAQNAASGAASSAALGLLTHTFTSALGGETDAKAGPHSDDKPGAQHPADETHPESEAAKQPNETAGAAPHPASASGGLTDASPAVQRALSGDPAGVQGVLHEFERWELAIQHLDKGTGPAAGLSQQARAQLASALQSYRDGIAKTLAGKFHAQLVGQASIEAASDMDFNFMGDDAGANLIKARDHLASLDPAWAEHYRFGLLVDAGRVGTLDAVVSSLPAAEQARIKPALDQKVTQETELYVAARRARLAEGPKRAKILESIPDRVQRARITELVGLDAPGRQAMHDAALRDGDVLMKEFKAAQSPEERLRLAKEITEKQMLANALNDEAYVSPGAVGHFVSGVKATSPAAQYQTLIDQLAELQNLVANQYKGSMLAALRGYESYKYILRSCEMLEKSGLVANSDLAAALQLHKSFSEYVYRVQRAATESVQGREGVPVAKGAFKSRVRPNELQTRTETRTDPISGAQKNITVAHLEAGTATGGMTDEQLIKQYRLFQDLVDRYAPQMREKVLGDGPAPAVLSAPEVGRTDAAHSVAQSPTARNSIVPDAGDASTPSTPNDSGTEAAGGTAAKATTGSLSNLREEAKVDKDAAERLRGQYEAMSDKQLSQAAKRDGLAKYVLDERRASKPNDVERWKGPDGEKRPVPHEATAVATDATGREVWRGREISGNMTPAEKDLGYPKNSLATHTEVRLVNNAQLPRGGTLKITAQYDPCDNCQRVMREAAKRTGCTISYWWQGGTFVAEP